MPGADLVCRDLADADLIRAFLGGVNLTGAELESANLAYTISCRTRMPDGSTKSDNCPCSARRGAASSGAPCRRGSASPSRGARTGDRQDSGQRARVRSMARYPPSASPTVPHSGRFVS